MGRVARSERTKSQLRAERRGIVRAKRVMSRPAPRRQVGRYVVAPGYKPVKRGNKVVPKKKATPVRKSPVFTARPVVRGPEKYRALSQTPRFTLSKDKLTTKRGSYTPGTIEFRQAQRFSRSPMGALNRQLRKEEKRQSALAGKPIKLKLDRRSGKVTRIVGAKAVKRDAKRRFTNYQNRQAERRKAKQPAGDQLIKEIGNLAAATATGLLPSGKVASGLAKGEVAKTEAKAGVKIKTGGINLPRKLDQQIKAKKPENLLRLVDQTQRPALAVTGGAEKAVRNVKAGKTPLEGVPGEALKGLKLQERQYGSDVLKAAGIGGLAAAIGGFALDVGADPLTYVTFGAGSAGKIGAVQAAKAAGRQAERKAFKGFVRQGLEKKVAREKAKKVGTRVEAQVFKREVKDDRFAVRVGGKRRGKTIKTPLKVKQKPTGAGGKTKSAASNFRPTVTPSGADPIQYAEGLNANRNVRAVTSAALGAAQISADWLARKIKTRDYDGLINALERNTPAGLPKYLTEKSVKVRVNPASTKEYKSAFAKARKDGASVDEATDTARRAVQSNKQQYREISIFEAMRSDFRQAQRLRKQAGQKQGTIRDYFPHMVDETLRKRFRDVDEATAQADDLTKSLRRTSAGRSGSTMQRNIRLTLAEANQQLREQGKRQFSVDVPLVMSNYKLQTGKILAQGKFNEEVANLGRRVKIRTAVKPKASAKNGELVEAGTSVTRRANLGELEPNEGVYVKTFEARTTDTGAEIPGRVQWRKATNSERRALEGGTVPRNIRDVVVADKTAFKKVEEAFDQFTVVPRELKRLKNLDDPSGGDKIKRGAYWVLDNVVDPPMRVWKGIATRTPQFHLRNQVGDFSMAYNVVPASRLPQLSTEALKVTWYLRGRRKNMMGFSDKRFGDTVIRLGYRDKTNLGKRYEMMDIADFADELIDNGVILGGVLGSDLDSYSKFGARGISKMNNRAARSGRGIDRALQDRENFMRIVVYKHFRDEGMSPKQAARKTADTLIDYGELSVAEREVFKRAAPFYTFAARSIPIYALTFVKRPGKIANVEKLRQETARATGTDAETLKDEQTYRQRGYAFPIRINGTQYMPSFGLPLMALNQLPAGFSSADLIKTINENKRFIGGSLAPTIGIPIETWRNYSFFYDRELEPDPPRRRRTATVLPSVFDTIAAQLGGTTTASGKDNRNRTILGIGPVRDRRTGKMVTGIRGKADNAIAKLLPGAPGLVLNLSRDTNRRGQGEKQMLFSFGTGIKADTADPQAGVVEQLFKELKRVDQEIADIPGKTGRDKKDRDSLNKRKYQIQAAIYELDKKSGNAVPLFAPPGRKKSKGWASSSSSSGGWATRKSGSKGWAE